MNNGFVAVTVLISAVLATGLGIVYTKHYSRQLFIDLQALQGRRDNMEIEWEQLQLELSTLATEVAVDHAAHTRLNMVIPPPDAVLYIRR
jgi:cell division protein FtsL